MVHAQDDHVGPGQDKRGRIIAGFTLALVIALCAFFLIEASSDARVGFGSLWFLTFLPAYLCALICYVGDRDGTRPASFYSMVPVAFAFIVVAGSMVILHEGVICVLMLLPLWLFFGWLGANMMRRSRRWTADQNTFRSSLVLMPLFAGTLEAQVPVPHDRYSVVREIVIEASPEEIWPYAVSNRHIAESEGRWTFTQDILGVPRPRATTVTGSGVGHVRTAYWGDHINFEERITQWQPGRRLGWRFAFTNSTVQDYTDKHIAPDGEFLKIDTGDYTLTRLSPTTTRLTPRTNYIAKTHANPYAALWGEILLGDVQSNVLAVIKARAEARHRQSDHAQR
ncbi:SRPBCC family protein [Novosphingobium sp. AAP93]|uniref:SRPBCC family protein n=1 Tax=Novosphingobium sp. AAP93 TaxID=1523427 RepID=UPI0006BA0747|nr:SRPBCC family protein [Novosphingobium sp. AAP93]KPF88730.1 hypothetical protein IP83_04995 [Novosphingobium sp. AAP93]